MPLTLPELLAWSTLGALLAGLGAMLGVRHLAGGRLLGIAVGLAAGMMLGAGYASLTAGLAAAPLFTLLGGAIGVIVTRALDAGDVLSADEPAGTIGPTDAWLAVRASVLHSAGEGITIGAGAAIDASFGYFLIATFALHNLSEGAMVANVLRGAGWSGARASAVSLATRLAQPAVAAAVFLLGRAVPTALPWLLGASFGALLYLIVAELLPQSYRQAGRTAIALGFSVAAGVVALLAGRNG